MAVLRLWSGLKNNNRGVVMYDYTYWLPEVSHHSSCRSCEMSFITHYVQVLIFSCLEVDFAIICASIPIFWPAVIATWSQITVTREVIVTSESRVDCAHLEDLALGVKRTLSLKSNKSTEGLVAGESMDGRSFYIDTHSEPRKLHVLPSVQYPRISWGGTPL